MAEIFPEYSDTQGQCMLPVNSNFTPDYSTLPVCIYNNTIVTRRTYETLIKDNHETINAIEKRRIMNMLDFDNFKGKLDYKEEVRMRNDLSATSIYWDARGGLKIEISSYNGPIKAERLCDLQKLKTKATLYRPVDSNGLEKPIYVVSYHLEDCFYQIPLSWSEYGKGKLLKKMLYNGISFYVSQKKQNEIACDFEAFIFRESQEVIIPMAHGWYIVDGTWRYASKGELIWEDIKCGKYN